MILLEVKKLRRMRMGLLIFAIMVGMVQALLSPIFVSLVATRLVEIEHEGNGWQVAGTAGIPRGKLCTTKAILTGIITTVIVAIEFAAIIGIGFLRLGSVDFEATYWLGYAVCLMVVNVSLGLLHVILAAYVDNQLVNLGVGVLGVCGGVFATAARCCCQVYSLGLLCREHACNLPPGRGGIHYAELLLDRRILCCVYGGVWNGCL